MSNMTRRQMLKGFALGSIVAASSGLATGCAPSSPLSDAGKANGTEKVYQFAKRTSEVSDRIPVETDVLSSAAGEQGCARLWPPLKRERVWPSARNVDVWRSDRPLKRQESRRGTRSRRKGRQRQHRRLRHGHHAAEQLQRAARLGVYGCGALSRHRGMD